MVRICRIYQDFFTRMVIAEIGGSLIDYFIAV